MLISRKGLLSRTDDLLWVVQQPLWCSVSRSSQSTHIQHGVFSRIPFMQIKSHLNPSRTFPVWVMNINRQHSSLFRLRIKIFPIPYLPFTQGCWAGAFVKVMRKNNFDYSCCFRRSNFWNIFKAPTPWQRTASHPSSMRECRTSVLGMFP